MVTLWGLAFILVLTMISGARELMTPGAWERSGATYKLAGSGAVADRDQRMAHLAALKHALWQYASKHGGRLPESDRVAEIAPDLWETPEVSRARYVYVAGRKADVGTEPVAYEPLAFPSPRLVLTSDGRIRSMHDTELRRALERGRGGADEAAVSVSAGGGGR